MKKVLFVFVMLAGLMNFSCQEASVANNSSNRPVSNPTPGPVANSNGMNAANTQRNVAYNSPANANKAVNGKPTNANVKPTRPALTQPPPPPQAQVIEKKDEGLFSFPPPRVTSFVRLDSNKFIEQGATSFGSVAEKVASSLKEAGYASENYSYFWNDTDEFAIVTKMERIDKDGGPLADPGRWDDSEQFPVAGGNEVGKYFSYLIFGKKVYYRVFAFVVTRKNYNFYKNQPPSFEAAKDWMSKGFSILGSDDDEAPDEQQKLQGAAFDEKFHCYALLYLFVNHTSLDEPKSIDKLEGPEESLKTELTMEAQDHLCKTRIKLGECQ